MIDSDKVDLPVPFGPAITKRSPLRTKKEIGKISAGQILHIQGTDPGSRNDIPGWCERAGHEYLGEKEEAGYISLFIKKG